MYSPYKIGKVLEEGGPRGQGLRALVTCVCVGGGVAAESHPVTEAPGAIDVNTHRNLSEDDSSQREVLGIQYPEGLDTLCHIASSK